MPLIGNLFTTGKNVKIEGFDGCACKRPKERVIHVLQGLSGYLTTLFQLFHGQPQILEV